MTEKTSEPATEPSFEQIADALIQAYGSLREGVVDAIRALYGTQDEAGESPRLDMYEPEDGIAEIDGVLWIPSAELDAVRKEEEAEVEAQQTRLEALRRSHEFIAVQEPETRVSASLLLSAVRWVLTGQVDE